MKKTGLPSVFAGLVLLLFVLLARLLPQWLGIEGGLRLTLRIGLIVLGLIGSGLLFYYLYVRAKARPVQVDPNDTTDQTIAAAEARLARSAATRDARIGRMPLTLVLGASGSTKTSIISHAGLEAELLAGEVFRGEVTVPTDPVNVWYTQRTILLEAGGRLLEDANRWSRLVRHLQPRRLAAAIGRGAQAPRVAIVCFACDEFLKPGAGESVAAAARKLRERLGEVSQQLGIRLPVYVLFTRADRLPFFTDYVRSLTPAEAQQVLGATLPVTSDSGGAWAERESQRLGQAFGRIVHALSLRRLDVLSREAGDDVRAGAYEFPRELRKVSELAVQFLIDVARPTQLGVNPFLRGFYFTGVRPVIKTDAALDAPRPAAGLPPMAAGATSVFDARMLQQAMAAAPARAGSRKVPEWTFLHRLFREVILTDDVAFKLTSGGARVDLLRRGLIGAAAAACVLLSFGFSVSFARNQGLLKKAYDSATTTKSIGGATGTPAAKELAQLDTLKDITSRLLSAKRGRPKTSYRWGLYSGDKVADTLRAAYFARFERALWADTRKNLSDYLQRLPEQPNENSDFSRSQNALAAYLMTSDRNDHSTSRELVPILMTYWAGAAQADTTNAQVARQFDFFANELPLGNPFRDTGDKILVTKSQKFLIGFGPEAYYRALVNRANLTTGTVRFPATVPLQDDATISGAYTKAGQTIVMSDLSRVDSLFQSFAWIYGNQPLTSKPTRAQLLEMYEQNYVRSWHEYLSRAQVVPFDNPQDGANKLNQLAAPAASPLLMLLAKASEETNLGDSTSRFMKAFSPLHYTVQPGKSATAPELTTYSSALVTLAGALSAMVDNLQAAGTAMGAAANVQNGVLALSSKFQPDNEEARVTASYLTRMLQRPPEHAIRVIREGPKAAANGVARSYCGSIYKPLADKFPFNPSGANADPAVVAEALKENEGTVWQQFQAKVEAYVTPKGTVPPGAPAPANDQALRFFKAANEFAGSMFLNGQLGLYVSFQPQIPAGASEVVLDIDGEVWRFQPSRRGSHQYKWMAAGGSQDSKLVVMYGSTPVEVARGQGPWSIFRLFLKAQWLPNTRYTVEFPIPGRSTGLVADLSFATDVRDVLKASHFQALRTCPAPILN